MEPRQAELWVCLTSVVSSLPVPGHVLYADIKMENGKSKGCGVVKFESPEVAERDITCQEVL